MRHAERSFPRGCDNDEKSSVSVFLDERGGVRVTASR
jgi:hypothetical protein